MMLSSCQSCGRPVLELEGQFSLLDSLYIHNGFPPEETSGWWHARCLSESEAGSAWYEARLRNFRDVRRNQVIADYPQWTVLRQPNRGKLIALGRNGELLNLSRGTGKAARAVEGGRLYPTIEGAFNLELDDLDLVRAIQEGLRTVGSYPLPAVLNAMGIADRVVHAEAIEHGGFHFDEALQHDWDTRFVAARLEHDVFVPTELVPHIGPFMR